MSESYLPFSPYNYVLNNTISNTDPDGRSVTTRYIDTKRNTLLNTNDGRDDVYVVSDDRLDEFKENVRASSGRLQEGRTDSPGWNNYWRGEFNQVISEATLKKAGNLSLSSEEAKALSVKMIYTGDVSLFPSLINAERRAQWSDPGTVAMSLTAFAHGMVGLFRPKTYFGYHEIENNTSHATRYLSKAGLNIEKVKTAITQDLKPASSYKANVAIKGTVTVDGVTIKYSGIKLPDGKINIGTIQPPR